MEQAQETHDQDRETQHQFVAELLRATAPDIGLRAAKRLIERNPAVAARFEPLPACKWKDSFTCWTNELAASMAAGCPGLFARQIAWTRSLFKNRGVPLDDLTLGLTILRETVLPEVPEEDRALVKDYFTPALAAINSDCRGCGHSASLDPCTPHGRLATQYLLAILEGDRQRASELITAAASNGIPVPDLYLNVLTPAMMELGRMWELNEIDIAEEHFATATTQMVLAQLYPFLKRAPSNGRVVVAATVSGNQHEIGVRMVADFFEIAGWRAVYLGPAVPPEELAMAVVDFSADLIVVAACMHRQLQGIADAVRVIRRHDGAQGVKILVGGPGFAETGELWKTMGADGFAASADAAVGVAEAMFSKA